MKRKQETDVVESGDDDDDFEGIELSEPEPPAAKKTKNMDREFSVKEITKLKKNETLFHSSLFRMQVSELLKSVSLKQTFSARIESAVKFLSKKIKKLPLGSEVQINDKSWLNTKKFQAPIIEFPKNTKGVFQLVSPSEIRLLGSVSLGTCVKPHVEVDLALFMPQEFLQSKDYLNQRSIRKKALYLAALASHLSQFKKVKDLNYAYHMGNPLRPTLIVTVKGEDSSTVNINLHVAPESHPFKLSKFHIAKNNVRPKWFFDKDQDVPDGDDEDVNSLPSTKYYNSSILQDLCMVANDDCIKDIVCRAEGLQHGIMLLKIWLHQRELSRGHGMFSNFIMTAYVAFLTKSKKLNKMMSSYQVFKTTLLCLSRADWKIDPPSLCSEELQKNMPSLDDYKDAFDCVFVDCTGSYNMAYLLSNNVFNRIKSECQASLELLEMSDQTVFDSLFMTAVPFGRKFDHIFHVCVEKTFLNGTCNKNHSMTNFELDMGVSCKTLSVQNFILSILNKALGKRASVVQAKPIISSKWHTSCRAFEYDRRSYLTFGVVLDPSEAYNILNKGPPADAIEAIEFRKFWGKKSEMRRFKDGSIHEAVLWSTSSNQSDRRIICKEIVLHVLKMHCGIVGDDVIYRGNPLDSLLKISPKANTEIQSYGTGEEYSLAVLKDFEQVNRTVRAVSSLPLSITSVQGVHPVLRHAEVFPPLPIGLHQNRNETVERGHNIPCNSNQLPPYVPVLQIVCGLESSGKWPNDRVAMDSMKVLLHVKLGKELKEKFSMCVKIHPTYVDIYKGGFVFRLILACTREITVMRTIRTDSGMLRFTDTEESIRLERDTVHRPLHSHLIHSTQQQHPVFSATVRLCKRWLSSQMVLHQMREEAVELIVAYVFLHPHPYSTPPASPSVGFMRFLYLFSTFNWKNDILMVNLNSEFSDQDHIEIPQTFKATRIGLPAICIATPQDKKGNVWTADKPEGFILDRLVILAEASLNKLESQLMSFDQECDFKQIFRPVLEHFDVAIKLHPKLNVARHQGVDASGVIFIHPLSEGLYTNKSAMPVIDFDVYLRFFHNLQEVYGDLAYFFFDCFGGKVIGMVWKSEVLEKKDLKISNFMMRRPVDSEDKVTLTIVKDVILDDIQLLGSGIIETLTNHKQTA